MIVAAGERASVKVLLPSEGKCLKRALFEHLRIEYPKDSKKKKEFDILKRFYTGNRLLFGS